MIARLIRWSIGNRFLVLLATLMIAGWGVWAMLRTPLDAIPDLSDVQVIIRTTYPGQAPQIVENQITYPLATTMMSVPGAKTVRGYSMFGDSFVYILFEDGTDAYWARSRVLEYLNQVQSRLPAQAKASLGPDATGVGWVYEYALIDKSGTMDLSQLRALQDWFLKYELKSVPNVSEVASVGGMVKQYQIVLDPDRMRAFNLTHQTVIEAVQSANQETGGSVLELSEAEYMVRVSGYLQSLDDFRKIPLLATNSGVAVKLGDVAHIQIGPEMRRGIAELDGEGEVAGGVIIMRSGKNALETIDAVKAKLAELESSLPRGVEIVPTYDRSSLIKRAVRNLQEKLIEEFIVVALVCVLFLFHLRSAFVAIVSLPLGVLMAFIVMHYQGVNANIMSLGGIAIAIGAMVDAAVVMIENAHKHVEAWHHAHPDSELHGAERWRVIGDAATQVGPALFFSLLIITLSFVPVFTLEAQEGRLFSPLAYTKTYAMAAAAGLAVTLVPVLMGYLIRGRIPAEQSNPINRGLIALYRPLLTRVLAFPKAVLGIALLVLLATAYPVMRIGGEFMPPLDEGDLLYMPSALPGISAGKVTELLQQTNRLIKTVPEVASVFGKAGRAETATDPAPLEMFETTIQFKPRDQWRAGMTPDKLVQELDSIVRVPGLSNIWVPPIRNRIDMLATGIKSPVGVKVAGTDLSVVDRLAAEVERAVKPVPGVTSAFAERLTGGRYIDVKIDRDAASRYGLNIADVQSIVAAAIGGENIGETVEGLQRFPINVRYPREIRDSVQKLRDLPVLTGRGAQIRLGDVAAIRISDGPPMLKSENARLSGWVYIDLHGRDLSSAVREMQQAVAKQVKLPPGYSISWSGQFEYLERATARLKIVVPATLVIIFVLLYLTFRRFTDALLIMATLPFALVGGFWLMFLLGYNMSVASAVGFIALAGVAAEIGVVMLVYVNQAVATRTANGRLGNPQELAQAIVEGAALRVRPIAMTVAVIIAGLLPIMWGTGTGSELMRRIASPMVGGMITAPLLSMLVIPAAYLLLRRRAIKGATSSVINSVAISLTAIALNLFVLPNAHASALQLAVSEQTDLESTRLVLLELWPRVLVAANVDTAQTGANLEVQFAEGGSPFTLSRDRARPNFVLKINRDFVGEHDRMIEGMLLANRLNLHDSFRSFALDRAAALSAGGAGAPARAKTFNESIGWSAEGFENVRSQAGFHEAAAAARRQGYTWLLARVVVQASLPMREGAQQSTGGVDRKATELTMAVSASPFPPLPTTLLTAALERPHEGRSVETIACASATWLSTGVSVMRALPEFERRLERDINLRRSMEGVSEDLGHLRDRGHCAMPL